MSEPTLGQVAYTAYLDFKDLGSWEVLSSQTRAIFQTLADAVAAEVVRRKVPPKPRENAQRGVKKARPVSRIKSRPKIRKK